MSRFASCARSSATLSLAVLTATLTSCSSDGGEHPSTSTTSPSASASTDHPPSGGTPPSQSIEVSPGGVTTKVDVPAESTEEQYGQACLHTKAWMDTQGGDPRTLVEPFLQKLQSSAEAGPATFNSSWAQLTHAQQAAVIIAVQAAADGGC